MTTTTTLFPLIARTEWWEPFQARRDASASNTDLPVALAAAGFPDPAWALAHDLLTHPSVVSSYATRELPHGLAALLRAELWRLAETLRRVYQPSRGAGAPDGGVVLDGLAEPALEGAAAARVQRLSEALLSADQEGLVTTFLALLAEVGSGPAALNPVLVWQGGRLTPVKHADTPSWDSLVGLSAPLARLAQNTEALLAGHAASDCLLYGARGSGKSTAVRGLVGRYAPSGLRLVEVLPGELGELGALLEELRPQPLKFVLFVDDLAFEGDDASYRPLKTLLEGGVRLRPANTVVYATSNRRHLVKERLSDRPDPLDDDVHAWDTHQERLALADRFGLVVTFPAADQRRYLELVRGIASSRGVRFTPDMEEGALRFAEWNNGYSGRSARQFVDSLPLPA